MHQHPLVLHALNSDYLNPWEQGLILVVKSWKKDLGSSLKKGFSKETKTVKKIKAFIRSKVHVEEQTGKLGGSSLGCLNRAVSTVVFFSSQSSPYLFLVWTCISQPRWILAGLFSLLLSSP